MIKFYFLTTNLDVIFQRWYVVMKINTCNGGLMFKCQSTLQGTSTTRIYIKKRNAGDTLDEMLNAAILYNTSPNLLTTVVILSSRKY